MRSSAPPVMVPAGLFDPMDETRTALLILALALALVVASLLSRRS